MPELNKSTIVIASVLKPVDDPRMYEKIGRTLSNTNHYQVHVIGPASAGKENSTVKMHPFKPVSRVSVGRFIAPWRILFKTFRLRPDIFIITTHELLYLALFIKLLTRCKIIYDVQENYYWNILYTPAFSLLIKPFIALYVRGKETLTSKYIDHFFLAEKGYEQELKFPGNKKTVLENKVLVPVSERKTSTSISGKKPLNLIFTGTLAEATGVFTAIDLAIKLHVIDDRFRLTIIGFCAQRHVREKIEMLTKPRSFIKLIVQDTPIPHTGILEQIKEADFGLITYQINPATMNSIPTKLYEYIGFKLPIILINYKPWMDFCNACAAAVVFDNTDIDAPVLYQKMMEKTYYTTEPTCVYWETEEPKLLQVVESLVMPA